jgi:tetratricopeptide (TPR) repeat protein
MACNWLVSGAPTVRQTGQLTVTSPAGVSRQTFRFASFTTPRAHSLGSPADRLLYRQAFLDRLRAVPAGQDPCAAWNGDLWSTLIEILEPFKGGPILSELFERGWRTLQTLPAEQRHVLEERWAEALRLLGDTARQLAWIERLEKETRERARQSRWREERVACHLFDAGDLVAARRAAARMRELAGTPDEIQRAILRMGDVELFSGNRDLAARHYADAQVRYRGRGRLGGPEGLSRFEPSRAIRAGEASGRAALRSLRSATGDLKPADAWKLYAVNDAAQSATIRTYLDQGALVEAQAALTQWENDTPMSKLSGDLLLTEARLYIQVGDYRRAAALLAACLGSDVMTSQLPDIMNLQLDTLLRLKREPEARELAEEAVKRFPGLPVAERGTRLLQEIGSR